MVRRATERWLPVGTTAVQLSRFSSSSRRMGRAGIAGSTVLASSPHPWLNGTSMSKKSSEIEPSPSMYHGEVPSNSPRILTL